ncbi:MAG: TraM recognition domain-containing protein [Candidatus Omnitrophica bacterium]|nr:TraM recognition domain-containing protein [Candidatus Omnitrophota bacterium]
MNEISMLVLVILGGVYFRNRDYINDKLSEPFSLAVLIILGILFVLLFFFFGHYIEKIINKVNKWRQGIKVSPDDKSIRFPFIPFDLKRNLDKFYSHGRNKDQTFIGLNAEKDNNEVVSILDIQRSQHMQILGMTGTGKTTSVFLPLIYQDALKNRPIIIIDAKGEMEVINQLTAMLDSIGRLDKFMLFSLVYKDLSCTYNPLYTGKIDPQIIIDAFFNNFEDDNSFFREMSKTLFSNAFYILHSLNKPFTPMDIYCYLNNEACRTETNKRIKPDNDQGILHLKMISQVISDLTDQYRGWKHVIAGFNNFLLNHSDALLNEDDSDIILSDAILQRKIIYFQLPTNAFPIQAVSIAKMIQANLRYISSLIQTGQMPKDILVSVIIDEYASFAEESFVEVLNKARSSGMMVTLSHQSLSDLKCISETFMKRIDENTLNKIYFKQTDPELCELIAKSMGTYRKVEKTYRMAGGKYGNQIHIGDSSNRIVNEFHFSPDKIKNLYRVGQGYFICRTDNSHKCVNFGRFENIKGKPYEKKSKKSKTRGLRLFERYYLTDQQAVKPTIEAKKTEKGLLGIDE